MVYYGQEWYKYGSDGSGSIISRRKKMQKPLRSQPSHPRENGKEHVKPNLYTYGKPSKPPTNEEDRDYYRQPLIPGVLVKEVKFEESTANSKLIGKYGMNRRLTWKIYARNLSGIEKQAMEQSIDIDNSLSSMQSTNKSCNTRLSNSTSKNITNRMYDKYFLQHYNFQL